MNQKLVVPQMDAIRTESVKVIIEQLGIAKAAFFCRETMSQSIDYLELKEKMFGEKTAREIYEKIKKNQQR
ncbi:MAG: hypothetical protein F6K40_04025 [Okeania sp. SIO3I5]|uniref:hypothetical protein n=1 Tax=Okeania sp. SIO3I5 TaxID=2607805 RepID=UPI0013B5F389|nr:hypothetical protein [Okeania sp. SIO3I5]NEQ35511.1 hypothetical protein [Okeania sp. SIO3I5]